jgi:hypothetical protein
VRRLRLSLIASLPPVLFALLAATLPGSGQESSASAGYAVRGTVMNAVSGQPIARALVALNQDQAVLTNGDGEFSFENVAAGSYAVSVNKPGFQGFGGFGHGMVVMRGRSGTMRSGPPRRVQVGPDMPALTFRIAPLAMIVGHVTLSTADPADGIQIQILHRETQNGRQRWVVAGQTRTRSDGSFRMANLESGSYKVSTQPSLDRPGSGGNNQGPIWGYPSVYYPGVTDFSAAGVLLLAAGQQAEADLTVVRQQFFPVTAFVHSPDETPASFEILDSGGRQTGIYANWDRRDGVARASVPNGTWTMEAHAYGRVMQFGSTTFQVSGAPATFAISVLPVPRIPVVIRREFLASADGSQPPPSGPGMNLFLAPADEGRPGMAGGGMNQVDGSNGAEWEINVTQPGRYWVQVQAFPPAYVASITSGGADLGSNPLVIVPGSSPMPVDVTLRNDAGSITGQVANEAPPAGSSGSTPAAGDRPQIWVYAIPLFSTPSTVPEGFVEATGQFNIPNLAPGSYRVVACDAQQEIDFHSPEGLAPWAGKGQTVTVDPGGTASVDLDVLHVTGTVTE